MGVRAVLEKWRHLHIVPMAAIGRFLDDGDVAALVSALPSAGELTKPVSRVEWWLLEDLLATISSPPSLSEQDRHVLALCGVLERRGRSLAAKDPVVLVGQWLGARLRQEPPGDDWLGIVRAAFGADAAQTSRLAWTAAHAAPHGMHSATRFLASRPDEEVLPALLATATGVAPGPMVALLARAAPHRLEWALRVMWSPAPDYVRPALVAMALSTNDACASAVLELARGTDAGREGASSVLLAARFPDRFPRGEGRLHARLAESIRKKEFSPDALEALRTFLSTGDEALIAKLPSFQRPAHYGFHDGGFAGQLTPNPGALDETERRLITALVRTGSLDSLIRWVDRCVAVERSGDDAFGAATEILRASGLSDDHITDAVARFATGYASHVGHTSLGRWATSIEGGALRRFGIASLTNARRTLAGLGFLIEHAPDQLHDLGAWIDAARSSGTAFQVRELCRVLMRGDPDRFRPLVKELAADGRKLFTDQEATAPHNQAHIRATESELRRVLATHDPSALPAARADALESIANPQTHHAYGTETPLQWLARTFGGEVLPDLCAILPKLPPQHRYNLAYFLADAFGTQAEAALTHLLENETPNYRLQGLRFLAETLDRGHDARVRAELERLLVDKSLSTVLHAIDFGARFQFEWLEPHLSNLLGHKAGRIRTVAARILAKHERGDTFDRAAKLLAHKQAATRLGALELVRLLNPARALPLLEARLDIEPSDDVRDEILLAVRDAWKVAGRTIGYADVEKRFARAASKDPLAPWLDVAALPPLTLVASADLASQELSREGVEWMLRRQARVRGVRPDLEAEALYALIDRKRSGDFALHVLERFLAADAAAAESWALVIAGILGDDRIVTRLVEGVHAWVKDRRIAFAEYGVHALAFQGSDAALVAIDALGFKYATKPKNVGEAAEEAFNAAAERRDMTPDELRDHVVPWLGFEPGQPLVVDGGDGKSIEVRVTLEFELGLSDAKTKKSVKSLPKAVPPDIAADMKEKKELLKHVAKAQTLRLENLLVVGHTWSASLFRERFLQHPVLLPFAIRLVWVVADERRERVLFRARDAQSLVNVDGGSIELPTGGVVSMVHPLDVDQETRDAWKAHLATNGVTPPFPQLERPVFRVEIEDREAKSYAGAIGATTDARHMKSTTERLAWRRGHTNSGYIEQYVKTFGLAGIVARLAVDDMHVVLDVSGVPKLGELFFTSRTGERLSLGEVQPNVFSETLADLQKIAKRNLAP